MNMYLKAAALLALTGGMGLACQPYLSDEQAADLSGRSAPGEVKVRQKVQFTDLPAPEVFVLRQNNIDSFQGSAMRFGSLIYDGIWNAFNTSEWYLHEMPLNGWKLVKKEYPGEYECNQTWKKGEEELLLQIYRHNGNTRVVIMINETPEEVEKIRALARAGMQDLPGGPVRPPVKKPYETE